MLCSTISNAIADLEAFDMITRVISGAVVLTLLVLVLVLPAPVLLATIVITSVVAFWELSRALKNKGYHVDCFVGLLMTCVLALNGWIGGVVNVNGSWFIEALKVMFSTQGVKVAIFISMIWLFCRFVFQFNRFHLQDMSMTILGIAYIPFLLSFGMPIRNMEHGEAWVWVVVIGAAVTDMAAYFVGVTLGKHKILPVVSPKKTLEGAIGGVVGCMLAMVLAGRFIPGLVESHVSWEHYVILGLLCGIVSQVGDWTASAIKRTMEIKDYGNFIPGHGGMLDRMDSFLFVTPVVYLYLNGLHLI
jgi:phosphatidate cytidylyltransferase